MSEAIVNTIIASVATVVLAIAGPTVSKWLGRKVEERSNKRDDFLALNKGQDNFITRLQTRVETLEQAVLGMQVKYDTLSGSYAQLSTRFEIAKMHLRDARDECDELKRECGKTLTPWEAV